MEHLLSRKSILVIAVSVAMLLCLGRLAKGNFDASYFIVAGTDFTDVTKTPSQIIVQNGQGYDGQFFYRYALNPFDFSKTNNGITVDHPFYRIQRIGYPFLAWLLSFGGIAYLVPWAMLFLNICAFAGIVFYTAKFISFLKGDIRQGLLPLLLCGVYMSLSRDLSEVIELFCFNACVYYTFTGKLLPFAIFATLAVMTRETSMIALLPLAVCLLSNKRKHGNKASLLLLTLPFLVFATWKFIIYMQMPAFIEIAGYTSVGLPFKGIVDGFKENYDLSTTKNSLQLLFWIAYLLWQVSLAVIVLRNISLKTSQGFNHPVFLKLIYLAWLLLAVFFSDNIYGDDWGFMRIFSLWNMTGFLLLIAEKKRTGRLFNYYSALLVLLTIARLIVRV